MNTQPHLTQAILDELRRPFAVECIEFACQGNPDQAGYCRVAPYVDDRVIVERLDQVVGVDWSREYEQCGGTGELICYLTVCGAICADGAAEGHERLESASSRAFQRAAMRFGIGRFLNELPKLWARARCAGESIVLEDGELQRLRQVVDDFLSGRQPSGAPPIGWVRSGISTVEPPIRSGGPGAGGEPDTP